MDRREWRGHHPLAVLMDAARPLAAGARLSAVAPRALWAGRLESRV
jgi:hypothetical protein